jgi:Raf kinase inhibitor-like YbhB/YbcL family protein
MNGKCITCLIAGLAIGGALLYFFINYNASVPKTTSDIMMQEEKNMSLKLTSSVFEHNTRMPALYACDSDNISPPLSIEGVPEGTISLALIVDDPDIPQKFKDERGIDSVDHWSLFNIDPNVTDIDEGEAPGVQGVNGRGNNEYMGPCPPPEFEPTEHRYFFKLFALDTKLQTPEGATKAEILQGLEGHILEKTELIGLYDRSDNQ